MSVREKAKPEYGNRIPARLIYGSIAMSIPFFALSLMSLIFVVGAISFLLAFALFCVCTLHLLTTGRKLTGPDSQPRS